MIYRYSFTPRSPAFGTLCEHISTLAQQEVLSQSVSDLYRKLASTPRWRLLKRYHLERQLAIYEVALYAFVCGRKKSALIIK